MAKHNGLIPSDEADKLYSYPTLPADSSKILLGNGTWGTLDMHPTRTAVTGKPTANQTPTFGGTATISQYAFDTLGHITSATDRTIKIPDTVATTVAAGLMSKDDKIKLNGIATGAQVNTVTGIKGNAESAYRTGNVNITAANVGAAAASHSHSDATTVTGGFMSASDKQTLNDIVAELENIPRPIVRAFSVTGSTITATCDTITLTPIEEGGGIWEFKLPKYGTWTLTAETPTDETYTQVVEVDDVKKYVVGLGLEVKRYGYRIKESEPDPYERVEYILDAVGMTPAHMDFENEVFDYGSWRDVWFVADNKPLMLKYDGTVDYYLDPNDYTLREDGETASDVSNADYEGNAMAQFPLCWIYRYEDDTYKYEIVSNVKYDENYKAYAHTRADGSIADYFYYAMFGSALVNDKCRSLADLTTHSASLSDFYPLTKANGAKWCVASWSQYSFIRTLLILIGKSTNSQVTFGLGNSASNSVFLATGTLKNTGRFFGYNQLGSQVKIFHIENFWGDKWNWIVGLILNNNIVYAQMTHGSQGYSLSSIQGYNSLNHTLAARIRGGYVSSFRCDEYGLIAQAWGGSDSQYYCDWHWIKNDKSTYFLQTNSGALSGDHALGAGLFALQLFSSDGSRTDFGCHIACEQSVPQEETNNG